MSWDKKSRALHKQKSLTFRCVAPTDRPATLSSGPQSDVARLRKIVINRQVFHPKDVDETDALSAVFTPTGALELAMHAVGRLTRCGSDVFLRELISNANDAIEKLRLTALKDKSLVDPDKPLNITLKMVKDEENDSVQRKLVITDTGIGMSPEELKANLGTLAKSGTSEFLANADGENAGNLIGQFGVGSVPWHHAYNSCSDGMGIAFTQGMSMVYWVETRTNDVHAVSWSHPTFMWRRAAFRLLRTPTPCNTCSAATPMKGPSKSTQVWLLACRNLMTLMAS